MFLDVFCRFTSYLIMNLQAGVFLTSTHALNDTLFAGTTILVTEYNDAGAVGFVVNKAFGRTLNHLEAYQHSEPFPLYEGGPVDQEHLFFLHSRPDLVADGTLVAHGIYLGGNFDQAVACINNKTLSAAAVKIFVGYCGWDAGELEAEVAEGSWMVSGGAKEAVFS